MMQRLILSALIGLSGAVNNNGKLDTTDAVVRRALLSEDSQEVYQLVRDEKYRISPGCLSCQSPCGNTSDYSLEKFESTSSDLMALKDQVYDALCSVAKSTEGELPEYVYTGISYLGYDLDAQSYSDFLKEICR